MIYSWLEIYKLYKVYRYLQNKFFFPTMKLKISNLPKFSFSLLKLLNWCQLPKTLSIRIHNVPLSQDYFFDAVMILHNGIKFYMKSLSKSYEAEITTIGWNVFTSTESPIPVVVPYILKSKRSISIFLYNFHRHLNRYRWEKDQVFFPLSTASGTTGPPTTYNYMDAFMPFSIRKFAKSSDKEFWFSKPVGMFGPKFSITIQYSHLSHYHLSRLPPLSLIPLATFQKMFTFNESYLIS